MVLPDPKSIAIQFNDCINSHDVEGLSRLMTDDHTFIDREGHTVTGKDAMTRAWTEFFAMFPAYTNTFEQVKTQGPLVVIQGFATWKPEDPPDHVLWTAKIRANRVAEWCVQEDTPENRARFHLS